MQLTRRVKYLICILGIPFIFYLAMLLFLSLPQLQTIDAAPSWFNDSAIAKLNVSNSVPQVVDVIVDDIDGSPADEIDLTSGTFKKVWCNGTVTDRDGGDDIIAANATLFFTDNTSSDVDDRNEHYSNVSCAETASNTYNKTFSCTFGVWFFANNGTWNCNMSAWDNGTFNLDGQNAFNSSTDDTGLQPLYALDVPPVIDYGELPLGQSSSSDVIENVTNTGNMDLDLELYGYGGTLPVASAQENNFSMICDLGNITIGDERFSLSSGTAYGSMTNLSGQFVVPNSVDITIPQRTSETVNSTENTYWKIGVPDLGVKGQCNGTIVFTSVENS